MPDSAAAIDEIKGYRKEIDSLDKEILSLLNKRAEKSLAIRSLKPGAKMGLYDPKREEEILGSLSKSNDGPLYDEDVREIFSTILKVMKEIQA